ncbi:phage tail protein [Chryseobacterium camelliae]|uniref:phage tail protein n=1 Tax=Chryseobacterium camelliae TaxID=1265445 RepID=UPI00285D57B6|nr:tail fiber protein [Chryseobacterium camelliae]MDR6517328.1 microcystin-dependent protein [Chryseobacterium camelliae]
MDGTIGEIRLFAANFAPRNWQYCNGMLLAIRSNTALFSLFGTVYGGDGVTTFGLPNLAGRSAVGVGQASGLSYYQQGKLYGTNSVTLTMQNLPAHTHTVSGNVVIPAYSDEGDSGTPANNVLAAKSAMYSDQGSDSTTRTMPLALQIGTAGSSDALTFVQPSLGMNYIVCLYGVFPQRS